MASDRKSQEKEIARLKESNRMLDEHVKSLVQTELRLHKTRRRLDAELERIRDLSDLTLDLLSWESPVGIVLRARELLESRFDVDRTEVVIVPEGAGKPAVMSTGPDGVLLRREVPIDADELPILRSLERTVHFQGAEQGKSGPWSELAQLLERIEGRNLRFSPQARITCVPIRPEKKTLFGLVLLSKDSPESNPLLKEPITAERLPFLNLLAVHVERAILNARLTAQLERRSRELAESNRQLTASLEDLERTHRQLLQARKMEAIGRLAGGIAHDFNNLLTVILGHAQMVREDCESGSTTQDDADQILEAATRAARLTGQLLAFSRKQARKPAVRSLNRLVTGSIRMLDSLVGETIRLEVSADPEAGNIRVDRTQFEQILLNLVVNGRDAMDRSGVLTLVTRPAGKADYLAVQEQPEPADYAALLVSDTGTGMDPETRAKIFEPFFTTKKPGQGTGMGLAMVYGLVRQNGGYIGVWSEPGEGARFTILFPRVTAPEDREEPGTGDAATGRSQGRGTILLVDDEEMIRDLTRRTLESAGYDVLAAADGQEALEKAREYGIDRLALVLTDAVMPRLGSAGLAGALRKERPGLPVVYMSGYAFDTLDIQELGEGEYYLPKPFAPSVLLEKLRKALRPVNSL